MDKQEYIARINQAFLEGESGKIYRCIIEEAEQILIEKALERASGNQILAAKILGINRNTLRTKIKKLNIQVGRFKV